MSRTDICGRCRRIVFKTSRLLSGVPPEKLMHMRFWAAWGRWPDLHNPTLFDEKLVWLNSFWRHPLKSECGDKHGLRGYAGRSSLTHLLPKVFAVYCDAEDIDFDALPDRFVLKCTHGCKFNIFCRDKRTFDRVRARRLLSRWMSVDYSRTFGELHYTWMKPRIVCEELLDDGTGVMPTDFKLYCTRGTVHCVLICSGRVGSANGNEDFRDLRWNPLDYNDPQWRSGRSIEPPASLDQMLPAAARLSEPFPFVRVDFYDIHGHAVLGEMTFTPSGCVDATLTESGARALGRTIELPEPLGP